MLRVLEEKRAVSHTAEGRTFVFYPTVPETDFKQSEKSSRTEAWAMPEPEVQKDII